MAITSIGIGPTKLLYKPPSAAYPIFQNSSVSAAASRWLCVGSVKANLSSLKGGRAGVLERPTFDQSQPDSYTQVLEGGDIGRLKDKKGIGSGDSYRVLLINDIRRTEKLVAKVLPQVVPSVTPDDARKLFHESREMALQLLLLQSRSTLSFMLK